MRPSKKCKTIYTIALALALLLSVSAFTLPGKVYAESIETVTIGESQTASDWLPHRTRFKYSRSQIIYDASDIKKTGTILSVAFNVAETSPGYRISNMKIWMGYSDLDRYDDSNTGRVANSAYTLREPDITLVYSGAPDIGESTGWQTIELEEPFDYDWSKGNLVIVTSVAVKSQGSDTLKYYSTQYGDGTDRSKLTALEADDDSDQSILDPDSYSGSNVWRIRSARPDIQLGIDTSSGGETASCEVSFDTDGGEPVPETQTVARGEKVTEPQAPEKEGYKFTGWFRGERQYDFNSKVNKSFTLTAGWKKMHTITFTGWNGEVLQTSQTEDGEKPEYEGETPVRPSEDGVEYVFAGWDPAITEADSDTTYAAVFLDKSQLADKTELNAAISKATDARTGVRSSDDGLDVGKNFQYVTEAELQAYNKALDDAQAVADDPFAKTADVEQAVTDLETAKETFLAAKKNGRKDPPEITEIIISRNSGRQQPAAGGVYEWKVTFEEGTVLSSLPAGKVTDDDFQIQRKPYGSEWKNSKCPYVSFRISDADGESNVGYLTGMAIPDNTKETDTTNLWRFIYSGDSVDCPVITQDGYSNVDKSELKNAIQDAKDAQEGVNVSADGWDVSPSEIFVTPAEKKALDDAIAEAQSVDSNDRASQAQVDQAVSALRDAIDTYVNAKKGGNGEDEQAGYLQGDYRLIYETETVTMADIPVREYNAGQTGTEAEYEWFTEKPMNFEFYDSTAQESAGVFSTQEGTYKDEEGVAQTVQMLSGVKLIRGHRYIVSAHEKDYEIPAYYRVTIADDGEGNSESYTANMANYYISLSEDGKLPTDIKKDEKLKSLDVRKRSSELSDVTDARRVNVRVPVYYTQDGTSATILFAVEDATIKLTSPSETLYAMSDRSGEISVSLIEDENYMVQLIDDSGALALDTFPLTVKDHAENGWPKSIYNHFSCGSVQGLYLVDKQYEHAHDTRLISISGKTSVTGQNFLNTSETNTDRYFINDRQLDNSTVSGLSGSDYEVFRVDAVNMFRTERSRLAAGGYTITRDVPAGKTVESVCYVNKQGQLKVLKFAQADGKVTFVMNTLSMYPNVIIYKSSSPAQGTATKAHTATVSGKTVTAAAVKKAIKKAGGSKVTTLVIGKNVKKISRGALKGTKVKTVTVKSKKLRKKNVKGALKGSKVTTIKVKVGSKKVNKTYVKKYKKIFTKKNAGKKVTVKL